MVRILSSSGVQLGVLSARPSSFTQATIHFSHGIREPENKAIRLTHCSVVATDHSQCFARVNLNSWLAILSKSDYRHIRPGVDS